MKRLLQTFIIILITGTASYARPRNRVQSDLQRLLALHSSEMQAVFAGMDKRAPLPVFFCDVSFANNRQVESFLRQVSADAPSGQVYSQVSFSQFISINGSMRSVSYNLVNNGGNVTFVKSTNLNGQILKAVYEFDAASRSLKTATFDGQKEIRNSAYSI
jgi:hypothetical protein